MLSRSSVRPNAASRGRRSNSNGGLFADTAGIIHIRNRREKAYARNTHVSLHCEKDGGNVGEISAVPERTKAFPTCVRCLGMELDDV